MLTGLRNRDSGPGPDYLLIGLESERLVSTCKSFCSHLISVYRTSLPENSTKKTPKPSNNKNLCLFLLHFSFKHCLCPFLFLKMCFVWTRAAAAWWRSCRAAQLSCCWQVWLRACSSTRQHQGTGHLPAAAAAAGPHRKSRLGLPWFDMFLLFALLYYELSAQRFIITGRFLPCPHLMVFCLADHISSQ